MEALNWLPAVASAASIVVLVKFWIELGKAWKQVEDTALLIASASLKIDQLRVELTDHKVEIARNYATNEDVERAIVRLERAIENLGISIRSDHNR